MDDWDETVDLLVVGSGAAGLTGALRGAASGLSVLIVEKSEVWGGSMAMSAGAVWVPCNASMRAAGLEDEPDDALRYLKAATYGEIGEERLTAFLTEALRMVGWLEDNSAVTFSSLIDYPDYNTDLDGACDGGRSLEPHPFDARLLGEEFRTLHRPAPGTLIFGKFLIRIPKVRSLLKRGVRSKLSLTGDYLRYLTRHRSRRSLGRDPYLTMGQALAGRLRWSLLQRGVPLWISAGIVSLVTIDGTVVGAVVDRGGATVRVRARIGVLLATGGFERNAEMRGRYQGTAEAAAWTAGHDGNTGDGIRLAEELGAALDLELMREAWWTPALVPPVGPPSLMIIEKSLPHGIIVSRQGRRFVNEAASYNDVGAAMYAAEADGIGGVPAWWVVDATYRKQFIIGPVPPGFLVPDDKLRHKLRPGNGWLHKADTLRELALEIGINPEALGETVATFNEHAGRGTDPDFRRGETANDLYYSDPRSGPNPSLGAVATPPFYAVEVYPSDLGTKAGLITDAGGRVQRADGTAIAGLYAAGNTASTVMGRSYPGAGATLAPAMVGAFVAAETAATSAAGSEQ